MKLFICSLLIVAVFNGFNCVPLPEEQYGTRGHEVSISLNPKLAVALAAGQGKDGLLRIQPEISPSFDASAGYKYSFLPPANMPLQILNHPQPVGYYGYPQYPNYQQMPYVPQNQAPQPNQPTQTNNPQNPNIPQNQQNQQISNNRQDPPHSVTNAIINKIKSFL